MTTPTSTPTHLLARAKEKLARGLLTAEDLDRLASAGVVGARQRLMVVHTTYPSVGAQIIAAVVHEPVPKGCGQLDPTQPDVPYDCVHDAMADGWHVLQMPRQELLGQGDDELATLGYEFVLQKLEVYDD